VNSSLQHPVPSRPELVRPEAGRTAMRPRNRLLGFLSPATMVSLQPRLQSVELAQGEVLHEPGRPMPYGYFIDSGVIARQTVMANGRAISVSLIGPEGFAGFSGISGVGLGGLRLIAQVPTQAQRIVIEDLKRVAASSYQLQTLLLRSLQLQYLDSAQMAACNSVHEVPGRLSRWILAVQDRVLLTQAAPEEALPLTHELLSEMLGASRSTVSLAAETLKRAGLISYSRGNIHVTNRKGLEKSACECYEVSRSLLNEYLTQR
jgi:CRP-like cAMP-binding protein